MKRSILFVSILLALTGCASTAQAPAPQVAYTQACAAYGVAFSGVLQLRKAGKLDALQVSQVSLIDSQVTPICTGLLPADANAATQQITAAVTALTIMEAVK